MSDGFNETQLKQLQTLLDQQRSAIMVDVRILFEQELRPIKDRLTVLEGKLDRFFKTEDEDIKMLFKEFKDLKTDFKKLEKKFQALNE